ncbi:MAG TPA: NAD(P)-binding domain-containing protein [Kofleriaceae bacterium]|jgi:3-hydroxyisobutyrate dehydrogenase-like beta-hydroxyacid dehydrogenase
MEPVAFLGLGALGAPLAQNLLAAGVPLTVWNRTADKAKPLVEAGAKQAATAPAAIARGGVVMSILWDDASIEELVRSPGFLDAIGPGGVHVSMTTVTPQCVRALAPLHEARGIAFVVATLFCTPPMAKAREALVCLAGQAAPKARVRPLLDAMGAKAVFEFGEDVGAAAATKLAGNFLLMATFATMREMADSLAAAGVDPAPALEMLTTTMMATPHHQRYAAGLKQGMRAIPSAIPKKDVGLFVRFTTEAGAEAPIATAVEKTF